MEAQTQSLTAAGLNLIAQALTIFDADLKLVVCNRPFQKMFDLPDRLAEPGVSFCELIAHLARKGEYGPVQDVDAFVKERVEIARTFEPHYMERTRANGRTISVEGAPLTQGGWVTVYTDITSLKRHESLLQARTSELSGQVLTYTEELAATNRALAATNAALEEVKRQLTESEARMRLTTEMVPAHIAHAGPDRRYTYSNRRLNAVLKGRPADIVGLDFQQALGESAYARIQPGLQSAYDGTPSVFEFTDDASARRIRVAFTPDGQGGVYVLSMDITEETQAKVALQQTRRREIAAQITSGLAHDFSNLLTIILGLQSQLSRLPELPPEGQEIVGAIEAAAKRGGTLLQGLGDITSRRGPRPSAVNVPKMLTALQTLAAPTLPPGIQLETHSHLPDHLFLLDAGQTQDALLNLILNARDACGTQGHIQVTARSVADTWLELTVRDTGPGFSPNALTHACDPFFTTKGAEGTGLGLSMVYDLTKLAGGDLRLGNEGGAVVRLRLPLNVAPEAKDGLALLVEDDPALRDQYRSMLLDMGHSVIEAASADEATALMADLPEIELVVSDLRLEGEATGVDLAERIRNRVPVILMTSLSSTDPLNLRARQVAPVLQKPFSAKDLSRLMTPEGRS